jgi:hypothetical protein
MVKVIKKHPASKRSGDVKIFTNYQYITAVSLTAMPWRTDVYPLEWRSTDSSINDSSLVTGINARMRCRKEWLFHHILLLPGVFAFAFSGTFSYKNKTKIQFS